MHRIVNPSAFKVRMPALRPKILEFSKGESLRMHAIWCFISCCAIERSHNRIDCCAIELEDLESVNIHFVLLLSQEPENSYYAIMGPVHPLFV